jgi:hypothetical protein
MEARGSKVESPRSRAEPQPLSSSLVQSLSVGDLRFDGCISERRIEEVALRPLDVAADSNQIRAHPVRPLFDLVNEKPADPVAPQRGRHDKTNNINSQTTFEETGCVRLNPSANRAVVNNCQQHKMIVPSENSLEAFPHDIAAGGIAEFR